MNWTIAAERFHLLLTLHSVAFTSRLLALVALAALATGGVLLWTVCCYEREGGLRNVYLFRPWQI